MANGTEIWKPDLLQYLGNISEQLGDVTAKEQKEESGWSLLKSLIIPIAASVLLPGAGTLLSGLSGTAGVLGTGASTIGGLLSSTGGIHGILKTLGGIGAKTLGTAGIGGLTELIGRGLGAGGEVEDIAIDDPRGLGKKAVKKTKDYLEEAIKGTPMQDWAQNIFTGLMMQGGPEALLQAGQVGWTAPKAATTAKFQPSSITEMMGGKQSPMAQLGSGKMGLQQFAQQATPMLSRSGTDVLTGVASKSAIYPSIMQKPKLNIAEGLIDGGGPTRSQIVNQAIVEQNLAGAQTPNILDKLAYLEMLKGRK
jgi:hypothetical protein